MRPALRAEVPPPRPLDMGDGWWAQIEVCPQRGTLIVRSWRGDQWRPTQAFVRHVGPSGFGPWRPEADEVRSRYEPPDSSSEVDFRSRLLRQQAPEDLVPVPIRRPCATPDQCVVDALAAPYALPPRTERHPPAKRQPAPPLADKQRTPVVAAAAAQWTATRQTEPRPQHPSNPQNAPPDLSVWRTGWEYETDKSAVLAFVSPPPLKDAEDFDANDPEDRVWPRPGRVLELVGPGAECDS